MVLYVYNRFDCVLVYSVACLSLIYYVKPLLGELVLFTLLCEATAGRTCSLHITM
jgi:hypothetical protein